MLSIGDLEKVVSENLAREWYITDWEGQESVEFAAWWKECAKLYDFDREGEEYWIRKGFALAAWRGRHGTSKLRPPFVIGEFMTSLRKMNNKRCLKSVGLARPMTRTKPFQRRKLKPKPRKRSYLKFNDGEPRGRIRRPQPTSPLGNPLRPGDAGGKKKQKGKK